MNLIDVLKRNEELVLWNRFRIHRNKPDFRKHVLEGYNNPEFLNVEELGEDYPGKTIYLADEQGGNMGFFAELGVSLIKLYFADHRGFTPYVSWGKEFLYYDPNYNSDDDNMFLEFFDQVSEVKGVSNAAHLVRSHYTHYEWVKKRFNVVSYEVSEEYVDAMASMMKKYVRYNFKTSNYLKTEFVRLLGSEDAGRYTIGVHYRGTDFKRGYNNHPVMVETSQLISEVHQLLDSDVKYKQIFLATDDDEAVDVFRSEFGNKVYLFSDVYRDEGGDESIAFSMSDRENHKYKLCLEVLRDQYTLTGCDALVCGYSNVTFLARIMRKAWYDDYFKEFRLIDNGINHNGKSFSASLH